MEWRIWNIYWIIFHIRYSRLFWICIQKDEEKTVNPSIRIYINKRENRITFEIKTGCYLEFLTPETMKLLGSTKSKITKVGNGENVPYLEIIEVVLIHYNVVNSYQQNSRVLYKFFPNKSFGQLLDISPKNFVLLKTFDSIQNFHLLKCGLHIKILIF